MPDPELVEDCACGASRPCDAHDIAYWYTPHAGQARLHALSDSRFVTLCAGRRGGKTLGSAVEFVWRIYEDIGHGRGRPITDDDMPAFHRAPSAVYWCVAPTHDLHEVARRHFLRALPRSVRREFGGTSDVAGQRLGPHPRYWLPGDVLVEFRSGEHPELLVSEGLDGLWLTEAARLKPEVWEGNLRPALAERRGWCISDSTPRGTNWWHNEFWRRGIDGDERRDPDYANVAWTTIDNRPPSGLDAPGWAAEAANLAAEVVWARKHMDPTTFRREYEASFAAFVGQVYSGLSEATHRFSGPVERAKYRRRVGGYDWGRGHGAGVLAVLGERDDGGHDCVAERYRRGLTAGAWVREFREAMTAWGMETIWCDPSTPILRDLEEAGLPVEVGTDAESRDVLTGIERVAERIARRGRNEQPMLRFHASCENAWREMIGYRWRDPTPGGGGDRPVKADDHSCDALRYAIVNEMKGAPYWTPDRSLSR